MKKVNAAQFKEKCLAILDNVDPEGIVITKHGVPVAKLLPIRAESASLIGAFKDKIRVAEEDDLFSTGIRWDAES